MSIAGLALDILIIVLLAVTIGYCWLLNRRIRILQDSKGELAQLLKHFDQSTQRASESIIALQTASKKIGENIQLRIDKANYMLDDMTFMLEKGDKLVNQLEANFAVNKARVSALNEDAPARAEPPLKPVPVMERNAGLAQESQPAQTSKEKTTATLEAVLERVLGRGGKPAPTPADAEVAKARARSKSEQELLAMLKAGIKG